MNTGYSTNLICWFVLQKPVEAKYKKIHATDCESLIKGWTNLLPSCLK